METIYAIKIGSTMHAGITSQQMNLGAQLDKEPTDGSPYFTNVVLTGVDPTVSIATNQPIGLMEAVGVAGSAISSSRPLQMFLWKYSAGSARSGSSDNKIITLNSGLLVPKTLSCQARGNVSFECDALATSADGSCPWTIANGAVPSYTDEGKYGVRSISLSSGDTSNINSFTLDFGINTIPDYGVGDYCAIEQYIQQFDGRLTLSSSQAGWVSDAWDGEEVTAVITLGKRGTTAQFEPVANDYTITCHGIWTLDSMFNGSGNSPANSSATITLTKSGSTLPIVFGPTSSGD